MAGKVDMGRKPGAIRAGSDGEYNAAILANVTVKFGEDDLVTGAKLRKADGTPIGIGECRVCVTDFNAFAGREEFEDAAIRLASELRQIVNEASGFGVSEAFGLFSSATTSGIDGVFYGGRGGVEAAFGGGDGA